MSDTIFKTTLMLSLFVLFAWTAPVMGKVGQGTDVGRLDDSLMDRYNYVDEMYNLARTSDRETPYYESDVEYYECWLTGLENEVYGDYESAIDGYEDCLEVQLYEMITYEPYLDLGRTYLRIWEPEEAYDCFIKYLYHSEPYVSSNPYGGEVTEWGLSEDAIRDLNANREQAQEWTAAILEAADYERPYIIEREVGEHMPTGSSDYFSYQTRTPGRTYIVTQYLIDVQDEFMPGEYMTTTHCGLVFGEIDESGYDVTREDPLSSRERSGTVGWETTYFCSEIIDVNFTTWVDNGSVVNAVVVEGIMQAAGTNLFAPFIKVYRLMPGSVEEVQWEEGPAPGRRMYGYNLTSRGMIFWMQNPETEWWAEEYTIMMYEYYYYDGMMRNYGLIESGNIFGPEDFPTEAPTYENDWMF